MQYIELSTALELERYMVVGPVAVASAQLTADRWLIESELGTVGLRLGVREVIDRIIAYPQG